MSEPLNLRPAEEVIDAMFTPYRKRIAELERENAALQARIDELMLEFCPDEMTEEQKANWARHQRPVSAEAEAAIDSAIASEKENERG